jgi:hypothetical protein
MPHGTTSQGICGTGGVNCERHNLYCRGDSSIYPSQTAGQACCYDFNTIQAQNNLVEQFGAAPELNCPRKRAARTNLITLHKRCRWSKGYVSSFSPAEERVVVSHARFRQVSAVGDGGTEVTAQIPLPQRYKSTNRQESRGGDRGGPTEEKFQRSCPFFSSFRLLWRRVAVSWSSKQ